MARRLAAALALLLVVTAACGDKKPDRTGVGPSSTLATGEGSTTSTAVGQQSSTTRRQQASSGSGDGQVSTRPTSGMIDESTRDVIDDVAGGPVGSFAGVLLAPGLADRLVLDVRAGDGAAPSSVAIAAMADALRTYSKKPVDVTGPVSLRGVGGGTHSADEIRSLASAQGSANRDHVAVVHVLYLAGAFEKEGTIGVAVRADTVAVFPDEVAAAASPFASRDRIEQAVDVHELGHLLGLVDLYIDRNRDDPEHPGHSRNRASVMFWAVETSLVGQVLGGPPSVSFDADDTTDLAKIRGGAKPS